MSPDSRSPTPDSPSYRLPPSARDFFVYERVVIDLASTRQVAQDVGISQTRVRQVVRRVIDWLAESLPAETEASAAGYLRVARQLAADRLERFYQSAARKWETTEQCKFASLALRVIQAQSKLPVIAGALDALMANALDGPLDKPPPAITQPETRNLKPETPRPPPNVDCSPPPQNGTPTAQSPPAPVAAPPYPPRTSAPIPSSIRASRAEFLSPAQPPSEPDDSSSITELKITPTSLGLTTHRPLTRKERRRRARSLAAK